ncbi:hypothetical protein V8C35DRAFT_299759 [Trichoderma chlorosporum]
MYRMHNDSVHVFPRRPCPFCPGTVLVLAVPAAWERTAAACYAGEARFHCQARALRRRGDTLAMGEGRAFGGRLSARPMFLDSLEGWVFLSTPPCRG